MRIISGKFKNRKINFPMSLKTRPLKDSVRENIFNVLSHSKNSKISLKNSKVLDLYAGTGSFGLECMSREASKVVFVENNISALKELEKNIKKIDIENISTLHQMDVAFFFNKFLRKGSFERFDIVFFDPPYKNKEYLDILNILRDMRVLNKNHIVVIHREKNTKEDINRSIKVIENRIYGRSEIFFGKIV